MPKIIIREKDLTTNPIIDNTAFAVVIPGFFCNNKVDHTEYNDDPFATDSSGRPIIFDENGVFEVSSQS